jgi:hypothetical protein
MLALKPWTDLTAVFIDCCVVIQRFAVAFASSQVEDRKMSSTEPNDDLATGITLGSQEFQTQEQAPVLSEEIAQQAQQNQDEKPIRLKVDAEPAIFVPDKPINLQFKVQNLKPEDLANGEIVIHAPVGATPTDPDVIYTPDGLVTIPLSSKKEASEWNIAENTELPLYFSLDLLVNDDLVTSKTVMIDQVKFSVDKNTGGTLKGLNDKVELEVSAAAINESLNIDIRNPAPQAQPGLSLTWQPIEIIAVGKDSRKNIHQFKAPIKIKIKYDETKIFDWDEKTLTIYYYDPDLLDWFPIPTTVDTQNNILSSNRHLTVFDYKANLGERPDGADSGCFQNFRFLRQAPTRSTCGLRQVGWLTAICNFELQQSNC